MDIETYAFEPSDVPYTRPRTREECAALMLADIERHGSFVLSACHGDFGGAVARFYALAVCVTAPLDLRMERIKRRAREQYGERVLKGGDMYEQQLKFEAFAASRPLSRIEQWARTLACPVVRVDGTADFRGNAAEVAERYREMTVGHT